MKGTNQANTKTTTNTSTQNISSYQSNPINIKNTSQTPTTNKKHLTNYILDDGVCDDLYFYSKTQATESIYSANQKGVYDNNEEEESKNRIINSNNIKGSWKKNRKILVSSSGNNYANTLDKTNITYLPDNKNNNNYPSTKNDYYHTSPSNRTIKFKVCKNNTGMKGYSKHTNSNYTHSNINTKSNIYVKNIKKKNSQYINISDVNNKDNTDYNYNNYINYSNSNKYSSNDNVRSNITNKHFSSKFNSNKNYYPSDNNLINNNKNKKINDNTNNNNNIIKLLKIMKFELHTNHSFSNKTIISIIKHLIIDNVKLLQEKRVYDVAEILNCRKVEERNKYSNENNNNNNSDSLKNQDSDEESENDDNTKALKYNNTSQLINNNHEFFYSSFCNSPIWVFIEKNGCLFNLLEDNLFFSSLKQYFDYFAKNNLIRELIMKKSIEDFRIFSSKAIKTVEKLMIKSENVPEFLKEFIFSNFRLLSKNRYSSHFLKVFLGKIEKLTETQSILISEDIRNNYEEYINDVYSCGVVISVLYAIQKQYKPCIVDSCQNKIISLTKYHHSCFFIEKSIEQGGINISKIFYDEIMSDKQAFKTLLSLEEKRGIKILRKALIKACEEYKLKFFKIIEEEYFTDTEISKTTNFSEFKTILEEVKTNYENKVKRIAMMNDLIKINEEKENIEENKDTKHYNSNENNENNDNDKTSNLPQMNYLDNSNFSLCEYINNLVDEKELKSKCYDNANINKHENSYKTNTTATNYNSNKCIVDLDINNNNKAKENDGDYDNEYNNINDVNSNVTSSNNSMIFDKYLFSICDNSIFNTKSNKKKHLNSNFSCISSNNPTTDLINNKTNSNNNANAVSSINDINVIVESNLSNQSSSKNTDNKDNNSKSNCNSNNNSNSNIPLTSIPTMPINIQNKQSHGYTIKRTETNNSNTNQTGNLIPHNSYNNINNNNISHFNSNQVMNPQYSYNSNVMNNSNTTNSISNLNNVNISNYPSYIQNTPYMPTMQNMSNIPTMSYTQPQMIPNNNNIEIFGYNPYLQQTQLNCNSQHHQNINNMMKYNTSICNTNTNNNSNDNSYYYNYNQYVQNQPQTKLTNVPVNANSMSYMLVPVPQQNQLLNNNNYNNINYHNNNYNNISNSMYYPFQNRSQINFSNNKMN